MGDSAVLDVDARCDACGEVSVGARQKWVREYLLGFIPGRKWLGPWRYYCASHRDVVSGSWTPMTDTDPLARERFRTIVAEAIESVATDDEGFVDPEQLAETLLPTFPDAHFEYRTNDAGVRLRRVVAEGVWENDPEILTASRLLA